MAKLQVSPHLKKKLTYCWRSLGRELGFRFKNIIKIQAQKWHYWAFISIIKRVMADLLISRFYNMDFRLRNFWRIFYAGILSGEFAVSSLGGGGGWESAIENLKLSAECKYSEKKSKRIT